MYISYKYEYFRRDRKIAKSDFNFVISVCPSAWNNAASTERIFMRFYIWVFFENLSTKFKFLSNTTIIKGTLHEEQCTFFILSRSFLLEREIFQTGVVENQNTRFKFSIFFSVLGSIVVSIPAWQAGDRCSIPRRGECFRVWWQGKRLVPLQPMQVVKGDKNGYPLPGASLVHPVPGVINAVD